MKDRATVEEISGEVVSLVCRAGEACGSCRADSSCAGKTRVVSAVNPKEIALKRGDTVEFSISPGKTIWAGFTILIFPFLVFILAFLLSGSVFPHLEEGTQALFGLGGLALGFGMSFFYNSLIKRKNMPEILRKVEAD